MYTRELKGITWSPGVSVGGRRKRRRGGGGGEEESLIPSSNRQFAKLGL
jgi:hypothetical protein